MSTKAGELPPIKIPPAPNLYTYSYNSPATWIDPYGEFAALALFYVAEWTAPAWAPIVASAAAEAGLVGASAWIVSRMCPSGSENADEYDRRIKEQEEGLERLKKWQEEYDRLGKGRGNAERKKELEKLIEEQKARNKTHDKTLQDKFPKGRPSRP